VPLLAMLGVVAWLLGAVAVRRAGSSWTRVVLLVMSAPGLVVSRTHAWPGGPVTFESLAAAAAWLQWERTAPAKLAGDQAARRGIRRTGLQTVRQANAFRNGVLVVVDMRTSGLMSSVCKRGLSRCPFLDHAKVK
jgi:hypothetical protein